MFSPFIKYKQSSHPHPSPIYHRINIFFRGPVYGRITPYQIHRDFPRIKDARKTWGAWCNAPNTRRSLPPQFSLPASGKYVNNTLVTVWPVKKRHSPE